MVDLRWLLLFGVVAQVGFVGFVIQPFFEKVTHHIPEFAEAAKLCRANVENWKKVASGEVEMAEDGTLAEAAAEAEAAAVESTAAAEGGAAAAEPEPAEAAP